MLQIARAELSHGIDVVFSSSDLEGWVSANGLGLSLTDISSVISALPLISEILTDADCDVPSNIALKSPVLGAGKILGIGHNYRSHIAEVGKEVPSEPYVFAKYASSLCGPDEGVIFPTGLSSEMDYECELAVIIGQTAHSVSAASAIDHVFGYAVANDISARDLQRSLGQISLSKGLDTFCPLGPWITVATPTLEPQDLSIRTWVNDELRQDASTSDMVFSVADLVSYLSRFLTLHPGDIILTGTPAGVGLGFTPPKFLAVGDRVTCEIQHLGRLSNHVVEKVNLHVQ